VPEQELIGVVQRRLQDVVSLVEAMPSVDDFVASAEPQRQAEVIAQSPPSRTFAVSVPHSFKE
jgi:hypothetical protein